jgi:hypothetical protein
LEFIYSSLTESEAANLIHDLDDGFYYILPCYDTTKKETPKKPIVVTLCGSTKFKQAYEEATLREAKAGKIVLSCGCFAHADDIILTEEEKAHFDELHKRKIDISSEILVLNVGGYIGSSTRSEIDYAHLEGKNIRYLIPMR